MLMGFQEAQQFRTVVKEVRSQWTVAGRRRRPPLPAHIHGGFALPVGPRIALQRGRDESHAAASVRFDMLVGWAVGGLEGMVGWGCGLSVKYTMIYYAMFPAQRRAGEDRDLSCLHHPE